VTFWSLAGSVWDVLEASASFKQTVLLHQ